MTTRRTISIDNIRRAQGRIASYIHKTPVFTCSQADAKTGRKLYFKAENLQKSGSFKARGALNAVLTLKETNAGVRGLIADSSGNHAQALSWAASIANLPCHAVMPSDAVESKKRGVLNYGGELTVCGTNVIDRKRACDEIQEANQFEFIATSDNIDVIAGQGTLCLEFLEQVPQLDAILVPVSGGGMAAGISIVAKALKPELKVYLVTPKGKLLEECLRTGQRPWTGPPKYLDTIADGVRLQPTGYITTPILIDLAEKEVFEMDDTTIVEGMRFCFERMKLMIEATAGISVAAAFSEKLRSMDPDMKNIGVILCGGNVDLDHLPWCRG